jgi:alpha-beta hydrolase superfamily lysophospholipase
MSLIREVSWLETPRGAVVCASTWRCPAPASAVLIFLPGYNAYIGGHQDWLASRLGDLGVATYGLDHHSFGRSTDEYVHKVPPAGAWASLSRSLSSALCCFGRRAFVTSFSALAEDAAWFIARAAALHPGLPLFVLGESMGGALALEAGARLPAHTVRGVILQAPMCAMGAAVAPPRWLELLGRGLAVVAPLLPAPSLSDLTDSTFRDPEKRGEIQRDALRWQRRVRLRTAFVLKDAAAAVAEGVRRGRYAPASLLLLHGTSDVVCPLSGSEGVLAGAACGDKTLITYEGAWHSLFTEPVDTRRRALLDITAWLRGRAPGLGGGGVGWWSAEGGGGGERGAAAAGGGGAAATQELCPAATAAAVAAGDCGLRVQRPEGKGAFRDATEWSAPKDPLYVSIGEVDTFL